MSIALPSKVEEENFAPTSVTLTTTGEAREGESGWGVVGSLSATDPNESNTHTFTLEDDASGLFRITGTSLEYDGARDFESIFGGSSAVSGTVSVTVRADDGMDNDCCRNQAFSIPFYNDNEAPSAIGPASTFTVSETKSTSSAGNANLITTFSVSDPDNGQSHTCSGIGLGTTFQVEFSTCRLRLLQPLDFETTPEYSFILVVSDNGWGRTGSQSTTFPITINVGA